MEGCGTLLPTLQKMKATDCWPTEHLVPPLLIASYSESTASVSFSASPVSARGSSARLTFTAYALCHLYRVKRMLTVLTQAALESELLAPRLPRPAQ